MADSKAEDVVDGGVSLVQKMLSATTGSVLTSLLGMFSINSSFSRAPSMVTICRVFGHPSASSRTPSRSRQGLQNFSQRESDRILRANFHSNASRCRPCAPTVSRSCSGHRILTNTSAPQPNHHPLSRNTSKSRDFGLLPGSLLD
jgi:hypothetical protein